MSTDNVIITDRTWTDDEDEPLGGWVVIDRDEWRRIMEEAGGYEALGVFSSLTDPEGCYGEPQVYTAWGHLNDAAPLVDIRDVGMDGHGGKPKRQIFRRFVRFDGHSITYEGERRTHEH